MKFLVAISMPLSAPRSTLCVAGCCIPWTAVVYDPARSLIRRVLIKGKGSSRKRLSLTRSYRYGRGLWYRTARTRLDSSNLLAMIRTTGLVRAAACSKNPRCTYAARHVYAVHVLWKRDVARRGNTHAARPFFLKWRVKWNFQMGWHRQFWKFKFGNWITEI